MTKSNPLITVITATYNYSNVLRCAIESVLMQTYENFEYFVVGDGCTDDTAQVVRSFEDRRINWINLPENTGSRSIPTNLALEQGAGKWVVFMDHDDLILPNHIEHIVEQLETTGANFIRAKSVLIGPKPDRAYWYDPGNIPDGNITPFTCRREWAREIGFKPNGELAADETMAGDFFRRMHAHYGTDRFIQAERLTMLKFPALWRKNSYQTQPDEDQRHYLHRIRTEPHLAESVTLEALEAFRAGRAHQPVFSTLPGKDAPSGTLMEAILAYKGAITETDVDVDAYIHEGTEQSLQDYYRDRLHRLESSRAMKFVWAYWTLKERVQSWLPRG